MLKKEILDTLRASLTAILVCFGTIIFSYIGIRLTSNTIISLNELLCLMSETALLLVALYMGSGVFAEEKSNNSFEYLFSLRFGRLQVLTYKLLPRFLAVLAFFVLYLLFQGVFAKYLLPLKPVFFPLYFAVFLFSATTSLMQRDNVLTLVYNFLGFGILMGFIILMVSIFLQSFHMGSLDYGIKAARFPVVIVFGVSVLFFIMFVTSFRKTDLSNMTSLFKRYVGRIGLVLLGVFVLYIVINLFDTGAIPGAYTKKDVAAATFDKTNGYYRLWTLSEPKGVDIEPDEVTDKYRRLFDPQFDNEKYLAAYDFMAYRKGVHEHLKKIIIDWPPFEGDRYERLLAQEAGIEKAKIDAAFLLDRYEKMIAGGVFEDFSAFNYETPIPNLLTWLKVSKLYTAAGALEAVRGNWNEPVDRLIRQINFCKKAIKGSRILITNMIAKAAMRHSLYTLAFLMNREDCPEDIFKRVRDGLPPITYEEFGNRNCFVWEYLVWDSFVEKDVYREYDGKIEHFFIALFMQKNRSKRFVFDAAKEMVTYEETLPYKWEYDLYKKSKEQSETFYGGWFWWLQNPVGKVIAVNYIMPNLATSILKSYQLKTTYDMIRISAELHLKYSPGQPAEEVLKGLEIYQTLTDPCSGKPYIYNGKQQVLYSLGMDRDDDGGKGMRVTSWNSDFVIPLVLHEK
ncbi:MAG: hypothetical protein GY950_12035 [bacterium]|nr:hypothetical protein [bacterium]